MNTHKPLRGLAAYVNDVKNYANEFLDLTYPGIKFRFKTGDSIYFKKRFDVKTIDSLTDFPEDSIAKMKVGETKYTLPWALSFDDQDNAYLRTDYPAYNISQGTVSMPVKRTGDRIEDFEVKVIFDYFNKVYKWAKEEHPAFFKGTVCIEKIVGSPKFEKLIKDMKPGETGYTVPWAHSSRFTVDKKPHGTMDARVLKTGSGELEYQLE